MGMYFITKGNCYLGESPRFESDDGGAGRLVLLFHTKTEKRNHHEIKRCKYKRNKSRKRKG